MTMTDTCGMWMILESALIVIEGAPLELFIPVSDPMILSLTKLSVNNFISEPRTVFAWIDKSRTK